MTAKSVLMRPKSCAPGRVPPLCYATVYKEIVGKLVFNLQLISDGTG